MWSKLGLFANGLNVHTICIVEHSNFMQNCMWCKLLRFSEHQLRADLNAPAEICIRKNNKLEYVEN